MKEKTRPNFAPVLMEEAFWMNSQLSIARHYGRIQYNGATYKIVNKEGKDLWECTHEANKEGRDMAIPAGEPADLVHEKFIPYYRKLGRDKFIEILKDNRNSDHDLLHKIYKEKVKAASR